MLHWWGFSPVDVGETAREQNKTWPKWEKERQKNKTTKEKNKKLKK